MFNQITFLIRKSEFSLIKKTLSEEIIYLTNKIFLKNFYSFINAISIF